MAQIYKVSDDDWEAIMGEGQIREFAVSQVQNCSDDFLEENISQVADEDISKLIEVADKILNSENFMASELTYKEVELILTDRCYDIEKLNIY